MIGSVFIIGVIVCLGICGFFRNFNFAEFGMPRTGVAESLYLAKYKYIKEKGELSTILSLVLGSFGMIPLSLIMTIFFFILNSILYSGLMMGAHYEYGKFYFIPIFVSVRIFNAISVYVYTKIRLKLIERELHKYLYEGGYESFYMDRLNRLDNNVINHEKYIKKFPKDRESIQNEFDALKNKSFG